MVVAKCCFLEKKFPSNLLVVEEKPIESFFIKLNLHYSKWLINWSYNPHKNSRDTHLDRLKKSLDTFSPSYGKTTM